MKSVDSVLFSTAIIVLSAAFAPPAAAQTQQGTRGARPSVRDDFNSDPSIRSRPRAYVVPTGPIDQYSYLPAVGPYSDFPSVPGRPDIMAGDMVRIDADGAPVIHQNRIIDQAPVGLLARVLKVDSGWVGIAFNGNQGQPEVGWIRPGQVSRVEPPPVLVGQAPTNVLR